jgi:hypothetical protein
VICAASWRFVVVRAGHTLSEDLIDSKVRNRYLARCRWISNPKSLNVTNPGSPFSFTWTYNRKNVDWKKRRIDRNSLVRFTTFRSLRNSPIRRLVKLAWYTAPAGT